MNTETVKFYEVGGAVRDEIMGINTKDVDFAVEAPSFEVMEKALKTLGFEIYQSRPEFLTIRAQVPKNHILRQRTRDADFVLCRKDGPSSDGRRPDFVEPGTILDDLARRDFTVNAIAKDPLTGGYIDPYDGRKDLELKILRFVGDPMQRIREDGLRVLRGLRFRITKSLSFEGPTFLALRSIEATEMLSSVSVERIREELEKMFAHDTKLTLKILHNMSSDFLDAIFRDGLRLGPILRKE